MISIILYFHKLIHDIISKNSNFLLFRICWRNYLIEKIQQGSGWDFFQVKFILLLLIIYI